MNILNEKYDSLKFCAICNMSYIPSLQSDIKHHERVHDIILNGLQINVSSRDHVVVSNGDFKLLLIDANSTRAQANRVNKLSPFISATVILEGFTYHTHLPFPIASGHKFFLLCTKSRIIGYLDMKNFLENNDHSVWLIKMIWLAVNYRNQGLARYIVASSFGFLGVDFPSVIWQSPFSKSGFKFVQSLCPGGYRVSR